jgi:hypothetical protein
MHLRTSSFCDVRGYSTPLRLSSFALQDRKVDNAHTNVGAWIVKHLAGIQRLPGRLTIDLCSLKQCNIVSCVQGVDGTVTR